MIYLYSNTHDFHYERIVRSFGRNIMIAGRVYLPEASNADRRPDTPLLFANSIVYNFASSYWGWHFVAIGFFPRCWYLFYSTRHCCEEFRFVRAVIIGQNFLFVSINIRYDFISVSTSCSYLHTVTILFIKIYSLASLFTWFCLLACLLLARPFS